MLFAPQHPPTTRPSSSMEFLEGLNPSVIHNCPKKASGRKSDVDDYIPPSWLRGYHALLNSLDSKRKRDPNAPAKIPKIISDYKSNPKPPPPLDFSLSKKLLEELAQILTKDLAKFVQKNCGRAVRLTDGFNLILGEGTYQKPLERKRLDPKYLDCGIYRYTIEQVVQIGYMDGWHLSEAVVGAAWWILADKFADLLEKREWPFGKCLGLGTYENEEEVLAWFTGERGYVMAMDKSCGQEHI
ncbi:hypothetical protein BC936DRAFT_143747 [Jimgerdemannia flammicorona]|uniref:Uncharacterized protein n=1 Tax=Jimgerdemannia flammicorona TaxID=994334 RepID=A0A433DDH8_9FUNG|nr:hypothetical protein BC936DRAFT_143747 [Jimgerdemannia flammicorona]